MGLAESLLEALAPSRVIARGPKATAAIRAAGLPVWVSPPSERLDDAVSLLSAEAVSGRVVAFQHYGEFDADAVTAVAAEGALVVEVPVYRCRRPPDDARTLELIEAICHGQVDAVTFTSAPSVRNLLAIADEHGRYDELLVAFNRRQVAAACVGPVCAEAARDVGIERPVAPVQGRLGLLVRTLTDLLQTRRRDLRCGSIPFVVQGRSVAIDGTTIVLTPRERGVIELLLRRRGAVVSKMELLRSLGSGPAGAHALEATIARLRRRLGVVGPSIRAIRGRGYRLETDG